MKRDGRRLIIIPPSLGYGAQGLEPKVPSNATLIFSVLVKKEDGTFRSSTPMSHDIESQKLEKYNLFINTFHVEDNCVMRT